MSRAPWTPAPPRSRLCPYERKQLREAAARRRETHGSLDAASVRALQQHYGVSRATVYNIAREDDDGT